MKTNLAFKKYPWVKEVETVPESFGVGVYTTFDLYDYEDQLHVISDSWVDEEGYDNNIDYFRVGDVNVILTNRSFFIESEEDDDVCKVLQYIDDAISQSN